jgi:hypothetical protein
MQQIAEAISTISANLSKSPRWKNDDTANPPIKRPTGKLYKPDGRI